MQNKHFDHTIWITLHQENCFKHAQYSCMLGTKASYNTIWAKKNHGTFDWRQWQYRGVCNREEITAHFCYWMEKAVSIHLQGYGRQCILQKMFSIPQLRRTVPYISGCCYLKSWFWSFWHHIYQIDVALLDTYNCTCLMFAIW